MHINLNSNKNSPYALDQVESETDLRACFIANLEWSDDIYNSIKEANRMIAWIARNI